MTCTECGAEVVQPAKGRRRLTCTPKCSRARSLRIAKELIAAESRAPLSDRSWLALDFAALNLARARQRRSPDEIRAAEERLKRAAENYHRPRRLRLVA